jgi:23S rRNA pseudouridine1911/1915/1917 synthase
VTQDPPVVFEFVVPSSAAGQRLDVYLAQQGLPFSRSQLGRRIEENEVLLDGNPTKPGARLKPGQRLLFTPPPPTATHDQPEDIPLDILFEDRHLIVLNKPAGLVVHPAPGHLTGTLVNALLHHCGSLPTPPPYRATAKSSIAPSDNDDDIDGDEPDEGIGFSIGGERRPGIVHRLDQGTSGVLVCAKDEPTLIGLQAQFQVHNIERKYVALVEGVLAERGTFHTRYGRHPRDRKKFTARSGAKKAITHYRVLARLPGATLVEVQLETGRTHQIRVHFSEAGHPLLGDPLYGRVPKNRLLMKIHNQLGHQALHARLLGFIHPITSQRVSQSAAPPSDFLDALAQLAGENAPAGVTTPRLPWEISV